MNQSDIYHYRHEAWVWDQLQPNDRLFVGRKQPRSIPAWAEPFPEHLIGRAPEEIDQQERDSRNDEFLKQHGI